MLCFIDHIIFGVVRRFAGATCASLIISRSFVVVVVVEVSLLVNLVSGGPERVRCGERVLHSSSRVATDRKTARDRDLIEFIANWIIQLGKRAVESGPNLQQPFPFDGDTKLDLDQIGSDPIRIEPMI